MTPLDSELTDEQRHLAASRAALARMRERAESLYSSGEQVAGDAYSAETLGTTLRRRVAELADDPSTPLFFGKLAFKGGPADPAQVPAHGSDDARYHIGRRHVVDDAGEPMVLDWRAPLSRAFYRASVRDPQGVAVRRRFGFQAGVLTSFEDEHLDRGEELGTASRILTQEIERPRVGPMRDIVATIQPEQDELVRAALEDTICVQGAPGTGKTAVGLHRAAYLLYVHRERLRRSGVLIVGPNRAFLHYIAAVLPALGEVDVTQSTVDDLLPTPVRAVDDEAAQRIKHDPRMALVLQKMIKGYIRRPTQPIQVSDGSYRWRLSEDVLRRVVDDVRREEPPHAIGRERVRSRTVSLLQRQAEARSGESPGEAWVRRMARGATVSAFVDEVWPAVTAEGLVFALLTDPGVADGILTADEQDAIRWDRPPRSVKSAKWSAADAVLIDEAAGLIDRLPSFGHVVLDEAQDLSPMQCRAVARRCEHGSVTLLGDLAQGTAPWAATDWAETLRHLGKPGAPVVPLTIGFRVPEAVITLANRLLPALAEVPAARSLRRDGWLRVTPVDALTAGVVAATKEALAHEGSIAVIAADSAVAGLREALREYEPGGPEDEARVTVLPATLAKGLEYDHVIVVEPADIVAAEARGLHRLYVVLTRAVSRLAVVHHQPLPPALTVAGSRE